MKISKIAIREMNDEDIPAVSAIVSSCYEWLAKVEKYTPDEADRLISERGSYDAIKGQRLADRFYVAVVDSEIVGTVSINFNMIEKLFVSPKLIGSGIGSMLFNFAEIFITGRGYSEVALGSFPSASGFYKSMGMELVGQKVSKVGPIKGRTILLFRKKIATAG